MTMSKYKLTFSLASLVLMFALAFAAMPAMAAEGGPTVTGITAYSGKVLTASTADASVAEYGTADYAATRADFRVKITLSHGVTVTTVGNITAQGGNANGIQGSAVAATTPLELPNTGGKEFVVAFNIVENAATSVAVNVGADAFTGDTLGNFLGSQARISGALTLPALHADVTASFGTPTATAGTAGNYTVTVTFDSGQTANALSLSPAFSDTYIEVSPEGGATVTVGTEDSSVTGKLSYPLTVQLGFGVTQASPATISIPSGYVKGGASIKLPPAQTATQNPPAAMIEVSGHDAAERTYRIEVTFTPAADSLGNAGAAITGFDSTKLDIKDGSTPPAAVITTVAEGAERKADNSYVAILKYDRLSMTPLTIKVDQSKQKTSNPDHSAMVGEAGPGPGMDADPSVSITTSQHNATARTFKVDVMLTPGAKADGSAGDPITGFGLSNLKITDAGDVMVTATVVDERSADNSYVAILQYNPLDVLPLTVTTADDFMTSNEADDPAAMAMVPPAGTPGPTPTPGAPGMPTGLTATADQTADTVMLSWTAPTDDGGSAITGYMIDQTGAAAASYTATASPFTTPALAAGDYTFTVKATNANGTGPASNEAMATIDPAGPVVTNNPPSFGTQTIAAIVIWKGHAYSTAALPLATDDEGDTLQPYKVEDAAGNPLPAGLSLKANDAQERFIQGTATAMLAKTKYSYIATDSMGATAKIDFDITVLDPIKPTAPTGVTAMEEGAVTDPTTRTVNTNKVVVNWMAPVDATETSHVPAIPFGAAITGYNVSHTNQAGNKVTYSVPKADAVTFMTPVLARGEYTFQVQAINSAGAGAASPLEHASHTAKVADPPGRPTNLSAALVPNSRNVTLNWLAPADDGGAPITNYRIYVTDNGLGRTIQSPIFGNVTTVQIQNLSPGQYVFRAAAINMDGEGRQSDNTSPPTEVPAAPVTPGNNAPTWVGNPSIPPISGTVGMPITVTTLPLASDADGDTITYTVSPTLPTGLRFNATTRYLSGTPAAAVTPARTYTYMASDGKGGSISLNFDIQVMSPPGTLPPTAQIDSTIPLPAASIGPNQFVVLQRNPADSGIYPQVSSVNVGLANLDHLFRDRGGMALHGAGAANDLVFSEIMWGSDSSLADDSHSQWIELYNTTNRTLQLSSYRLEFYSARIAPTPGAIDEINTLNWGSLHGQRGRTRGEDTLGRFSEPVEIISMYLKINYSRVERNQARGEQLKDFPNGSAHGHWASSARPSLNIEATWRLATPGAKPRFTIHAASSVRQEVIINEIGNSSNDDYDWIELYNTTDKIINLKKWELSYVSVSGGVGKETSLFRFPDNDSHRLPAKSFLVIAASDPKNDGNDLAAGIDITKKGIDQVGKGLGTWAGGGSGNDKGINALYTVMPSLKLPNGTAKTLIILRHDQGKMGKASHFEDVVGTLSVKLQGPVVSGWTGYDANANVHYDTSLWPLHATGGPHGNTIDGTGDEDFRAGRVIQRNGGTGRGEKQLAVRGWTGIGYDLVAQRNAENGGTPGYHKDSLKSKTGELAGTVSISEIMLATDEDEEAGRVPRATRLPQWIEIYNASQSQGVNVNNWYLEIQNADSEDLETRNLHGTLRLPNVTIPPNQTIIVVSNSGLNSGNFPDERMVNLFTNGTYRSILNLRNRGDSVLSQVGFYVELRDHENNYVDEIGNLGVSRRAGTGRRDNFDNEWEMPSLTSEDGHRTSLIRVYNNGKAADGLMANSWRRAADTNFRNVPSLTYFGNHRDFGTPGYRGGGPLPVSLSKFRPQRLDTGEVVIHWVTESELNNAGFNILRTETRDGEYQQVNTELIAGHGTTSERNSYTWTDTTAKPNVVYYYQIQDVSLDGQVQTLKVARLKGNVSAEGKVTTTWGSLKSQD